MKRCFYNNDNNCFFYRQWKYGLGFSEKEIRDYIRQYKGSNITDFSINTFAQTSMFPSKKLETEMELGERMRDEMYSRQHGDNSTPNFVLDWRKDLFLLWESGLDFIKIWIEELRSISIRPWVSIRMNDLHHNFQDEIFHTNFRRGLKGKCDIVRHRKPIDLSEKNLDYSCKLVREHFLDVVKATLERYDVDGIELDWMREVDCFAYGEEFFGREILTEFMREVKNEVCKAEERYGHKIEIGIRCLSTPQYNQEIGLDVLRWAKEGLVNIIVPSSRYSSIDNNTPYYFWKQIVEPYGVEVLAGFDLLMSTNHFDWDEWDPTFGPKKINNVETVFGSAAAFLAQGVDGFYFFNYFDNMFDCKNCGVETYLQAKNSGETSLHKAEGFFRLWFEMTLDERVYELPRRMIYTYTDKAPMWRCRTPFQTTMSIDNGLPRELYGYDKNGVITPAFFRIETGKILPNSKVILYLGLHKPLSEIEGFTLFVNSKQARYVGKKECVLPKLTKADLYAFEIDNNGNLPDVQIVEIYVDGKESGGRLDYLEISINKDFEE